MLTGCAPLILARTPQVLGEGQRKTTFALGGSLPVSPPPVCVPRTPNTIEGCPFEKIGPYHAPSAIPIVFDTQFGLGNNLEADVSVGVGLSLGLRLGGKALLLDEPLRVGLDAGVSLYLSNVVLDAGLLLSLSQVGWEPYLGVRGFYGHYWVGGPDSLTGAITLGIYLPQESAFVELSVATARFDRSFSNGAIVDPAFYLIPAIGFRF